MEIHPLGGGRNSRVYRLTAADGRSYAAKQYYRDPADDRDRLGVEFAALAFLERHGVTATPRPLAADREKGLALYTYLAGERIPTGEAGKEDIAQAAAFLLQLRNLTGAAGSSELPSASEACFSLADLCANLKGRLARLQEVEHHGLQDFLQNELLPRFEAEAGKALQRAGGRKKAALPLATDQRTLSPSDFGFHNALRGPGGRLYFLDFEYFGWDDPAKTLADFILHPAMALDKEKRRAFLQTLLPRYDRTGGLEERLRIVYPLYVLKWCTILLNEFLPAKMARTVFTQGQEKGREAILAAQLDKARRMLEKVVNSDDELRTGPA